MTDKHPAYCCCSPDFDVCAILLPDVTKFLSHRLTLISAEAVDDATLHTTSPVCVFVQHERCNVINDSFALLTYLIPATHRDTTLLLVGASAADIACIG